MIPNPLVEVVLRCLAYVQNFTKLAGEDINPTLRPNFAPS